MNWLPPLDYGSLAYLHGLLFFKVGKKNKYYKWPGILGGTTIVFVQGYTALWHHQVPYLYSYLLTIIACWAFRFTILQTFIYMTFILGVQFPFYLSAGVPFEQLLSAGIVSFSVCFLVQTQKSRDLDYFLLSRRLIEEKDERLKVEKEFSEEILKFLPGEISRRIQMLIASEKLSIMEAIDRMMRIKPSYVVALLCDIREFTSMSLQDDSVQEAAIAPNLNHAVDVIEKHAGVPRQIADLLVAFFDQKDHRINLLSSFHSAMEMLIFTTQHNHHLPKN